MEWLVLQIFSIVRSKTSRTAQWLNLPSPRNPAPVFLSLTKLLKARGEGSVHRFPLVVGDGMAQSKMYFK